MIPMGELIIRNNDIVWQTVIFMAVCLFSFCRIVKNQKERPVL